VLGFADHGHIGLLLDNQTQGAANEGVVVGEEDFDFPHAGRLLWELSRGKSARRVVPAPGRDSTESAPPWRLTRSSMPSRPMPRVRFGSKPEPSSVTWTWTAALDWRSLTVTFLACA